MNAWNRTHEIIRLAMRALEASDAEAEAIALTIEAIHDRAPVGPWRLTAKAWARMIAQRHCSMAGRTFGRPGIDTPEQALAEAHRLWAHPFWGCDLTLDDIEATSMAEAA